MRETERFICLAEGGAKFEVIALQATIDVPLLDRIESVPGRRDYKLSTGEWVNETDDPDVFTLPDGRILRRVVPRSNR